MPFASIGALLGLLGVAAGAFGAHALRGRLDPGMLQVFETAARYQLVHALALLFAGAKLQGTPRPALTAACWLLLAGVVIFSGSLYALVLTGTRLWGAVTPIGGLCLMAGWLALALAFRPRRG
ncbi:MAG: DUF423 domain-containing protein [Candidatus Eisenbacteria bacterium]|nr:DUF423 domain-containing protein [Candidatus Eisenbacteria bacterium]